MTPQSIIAMARQAEEASISTVRLVDPYGNPMQEKRRIGTVAFWMKGDEVIENDASHIRIITDNPEKFGVTREYVEEVYERHEEKLGTEGMAREEIIKEVTRKGWIRVRHYVSRRTDYWSIQVDKYRTRKKQIERFLLWAITEDIMFPSDELQIVGFDDNTRIRYSFMDGGVNGYLSEAKTGEEKKMPLMESSLSRVYAHMSRHDTGTITAARYEDVECPELGIEGHIFTRKENKARNQSLKYKLKALGYGVTAVDGSYIENYGTSNEIEVKEPSFFVVDLNDRGTLRNDLRELGEEFHQDSILFIFKGGKTSELWGTQPNTCIKEEVFPRYGERVVFDHLKLGVEGEFMTKIRNRPFLFESQQLEQIENVHSVRGMHGRMGMKSAAKRHWTEFIED